MYDDAVVVPERESQFVVAVFADPREDRAGKRPELIEEEGDIVECELYRIAIERE